MHNLLRAPCWRVGFAESDSVFATQRRSDLRWRSMASGLSDFYRLEREELLRRGTPLHDTAAAAGAPMPTLKALSRLHADVGPSLTLSLALSLTLTRRVHAQASPSA